MRILKLAVVLAAPLLLAGCFEPGTTSNQVETKSQTNQQDIYNHAQPLPNYPYSNYRQALIQIETILATGDVMTWSTWQTNSGADKHVCKSWGYPIPATTQLSNPLQISQNWLDRGNNGGGYWAEGVVGQMDPTGVYSPPSALGTWVLCLDNHGTPHLTYTENNVETYAWPVTIENGQFVEHPEQMDPVTAEKTAIHPCKYSPVTKKCEVTAP